MCAILVSLGVWQVHRLAWKRGILAQIETAELAPPVALTAGTAPTSFEKVAITGRLMTDRLAYWGSEVHDTERGALLGAQLIVPMKPPEGVPVLVDLGWVPTEPPGAVDLPTGQTTVAGYIHPPAKPGWFTPADDIKSRTFYALDPAKIGAALGLPRVAPFTLIVLGPPPPESVWPIPASTLPRPPNNHLQYALTWFALAIVLLAMFALYVRKVMEHERH
jgi:surfeit locus 1 family protein